MKKKGYFLENSVNFETKDKATFFNLGPKNNYNNFLDKNIQHEIEKKFEKDYEKNLVIYRNIFNYFRSTKFYKITNTSINYNLNGKVSMQLLSKK